MDTNKLFWLFLLSFVGLQITFANPITVEAKLDSTSIVVGDQANLNILIIKPKNEHVQLPLFKDTLVAGVEIIAISKIDTIKKNDAEHLHFTITITSFEPGNYLLPALVFAGADASYTTPLEPFVVRQFQLQADDEDVLSDIKPILYIPFSWKTLFSWIAFILIIISLLAGIVYVFMTYVLKKKIPIIEKKEIIVPPHIFAIQQLDKIKEEKLWQQGKIKEFYSSITDVVRIYIENRFGIPAPEMTTEELMKIIATTPETANVKDTINDLLYVSDMVKFAKFKPDENDHNVSLIHSYFIVDKTKLEVNAEEIQKKKK
jgi:hypothetical protein